MGAKERTPAPAVEAWDEAAKGPRPTSPPPPLAGESSPTVALERELLAALRRERRLRTALEKVERWFGEFPATYKTWPAGEPMCYSAAYGSNGERDFMRAIARNALKSE